MIKRKSQRLLDVGSVVVVYLTVVLFALSLVLKGFTHEVLLEVAVFLVSIKLILMAYKNERLAEHLESQLNRIGESLEKMEKKGQGWQPPLIHE